MDAMADALKRKIDMMRMKKHADGSSELMEGGVTENHDDPDMDDSDHAPDLEELRGESPEDEADAKDPVSQKLQMGLDKGMDDEHGAHGSMNEEKRHMDILSKVVGGSKDMGTREGMKGKGLRERGLDKMREHLAMLKKKSGMD